MSAQTKTLAALLAAAVIVAPAAAEPKGGGKDRGAQGGGHEQNRGGGGEARGGGNKHREARQGPQAMDRPAPAPRQAFEGRGRDRGKQARQERSHRPERVAIEARQQNEAPKPKRWERERQPQRVARAGPEARPERRERERASYAVDSRRDRNDQSSRQFEKRMARQQQAAYRAEAKQQRQWSSRQRQAFRQAATVVPMVVYQQPFVSYARDVRYAYEPAYRAPAYPAYAGAYNYAPQYSRDEAYGDDNWSYPQGSSGWTEYPAYSGYAPYDAGYGSGGLGGLGGLFGGGGGLGDILVTLLPLLIGDSLGLGGLTGGAIDPGLLGNSVPGLAGGFGAGDYAANDYADPAYGYQDASFGQGLLGGDGLASLLPLVLQSGLFGGGSGGLGGLPGLDGSLGFGDALGFSNPDFGYAAPYAPEAGLLSGFGLV